MITCKEVSACCEQTLTGTFLSGRCELEGRRDRVITCDNLNTDEVKCCFQIRRSYLKQMHH
jgi:hypothetical protein